MAEPLGRRDLLAGAAAGWAALNLGARAMRPPNVLIILVDDLGYGDLGCFGAADVESPRIDRLAAEGLRFSRFYSNSPVCSPTRAALLSGCCPERVGVPGVIRTHRENSWGHLTPDARLLPALLKPVGYQTVHIGKWHLGLSEPNLPNQHGFDQFHGWLGDMMDDYWTHERHGHNYLRRDGEPIAPEGHATDLFAQWMIDWLPTRDRSRPYFAYLCFNAPHAPIQPPPEWLDRVRARRPDLPPKRAALVALIEHLDDAVGRVVEAVDADGEAASTLIVFVSDNGGDLGCAASCGDLRDGKGTLYEGGLRVPAIARQPGTVPAGTVCDGPWLTCDLAATALELAGLAVPAAMDGRSLAAVLRGEPAVRPADDLVFTRLEGSREFPDGWTTQSLCRGDWKLIRPRHDRPYELYGLADDPREQRDRIGDEPALARELQAALEARLAEYARIPWQRPPG